MIRVGAVVGVAALAWLVTALPAMALGGSDWDVTLTALLVCLIPNVAAVLVASWAMTRSPLTQTGVLLASFLVRPLVALGLGAGAYFAVPGLKGRALELVIWGAVFYLIILAVESYVVSRQVARSSTAGR